MLINKAKIKNSILWRHTTHSRSDDSLMTMKNHMILIIIVAFIPLQGEREINDFKLKCKFIYMKCDMNA